MTGAGALTICHFSLISPGQQQPGRMIRALMRAVDRGRDGRDMRRQGWRRLGACRRPWAASYYAAHADISSSIYDADADDFFRRRYRRLFRQILGASLGRLAAAVMTSSRDMPGP